MSNASLDKTIINLKKTIASSNGWAKEYAQRTLVQVYTGYGNGQHWVTVTGYKTTENGKISFSDLPGIDPWGGYYRSDLSHSSVSRSNEQYLKTNENGQYIVRTYFD